MAPATLEASTAGKVMAFVLKEAGRELYMAAPKKVALIDKAPVTTDERDSAALAHPYKAGILPGLRTLTRDRSAAYVGPGASRSRVQDDPDQEPVPRSGHPEPS